MPNVNNLLERVKLFVKKCAKLMGFVFLVYFTFYTGFILSALALGDWPDQNIVGTALYFVCAYVGAGLAGLLTKNAQWRRLLPIVRDLAGWTAVIVAIVSLASYGLDWPGESGWRPGLVAFTIVVVGNLILPRPASVICALRRLR